MGLLQLRDRLVVAGCEGTKFGYLIGQAGYFHEGHRAVDDCFALLEVLPWEVDGLASTAFAELYEASQRSRVRIFAENSPFDMKDHLKARGYGWSDVSNGRPKRPKSIAIQTPIHQSNASLPSTGSGPDSSLQPIF